MENNNSFPIANGYCHIFDDRIVLTNSADPEDIQSPASSQKASFFRIIQLIVGIILLSAAVVSIWQGAIFGAGSAIFLGIALIIYSQTRKLRSDSPVIKRSSISEVRFRQEYRNPYRAMFIVQFRDENEQVKNRPIILRGNLRTNQEEIESAYDLMASEFVFLKNE